jgi:hypothetical protein
MGASEVNDDVRVTCVIPLYGMAPCRVAARYLSAASASQALDGASGARVGMR